MSEFSLHLRPNGDGSIAVEGCLESQRWNHSASAESVRAVRDRVAELMEAFESHRRPLCDPVRLSEVGVALRDTFLAPFAAELAAGPARLLLTSTDPDCLNLPWELLPGAAGQFLVADARCAIHRTSRAALPPASLPLAAPPLRILFTACASTDQPGLDYEKEEEAILRIADKLGSRVNLEIASAGTFDELRELIFEHRPHIVHLSGHGSVREGIGSFAFENECGQLDPRDAREVA